MRVTLENHEIFTFVAKFWDGKPKIEIQIKTIRLNMLMLLRAAPSGAGILREFFEKLQKWISFEYFIIENTAKQLQACGQKENSRENFSKTSIEN